MPLAAASGYLYLSSDYGDAGKAAAAPTPASALPCLWGAVRFGDNIEDEWVIVSLLLQLCSLHPDLSIQVRASWHVIDVCSSRQYPIENALCHMLLAVQLFAVEVKGIHAQYVFTGVG